MSEKETTSQASRRLREKNVAKTAKAAKADKKAKTEAKKQPAPAKSKPQPAKKVAKKKTGSAEASKSDKDFMAPSTLLQLKEDAVRIDKEISDAAQNVGTAMGGMAACHEKVEDFIDRELWRYLPTPYVSETQWVKDKNNLLGSAAKLFSIVGKFKMLKGQTTQKQRVAMGARKGSVATAAARKAKDKGKNLPPEIIDAATDPKVTEKQLRKKVAEHPDTAPAPEAPTVDKRQTAIFDEPDELLADTGKNTLPEKPGKGGSGVVEGTPGTAMQLGGKVQAAILQWSKLYDDPKAHEPLTAMERLEQVCIMFMEAPIDAAQILDSSVRDALVEAARAEKGDFVMTNERACEMLMHQPRKTAK